MQVHESLVPSFYRAAHVGLRVLDARSGRRRFGPDADAKWKQFRGELTDTDRMDLLLRDASTLAPLAFAPRDVFALTGLSTEDPFGPEWTGVAPQTGLSGALLRSTDDAPADPVAAFDLCLAAWELAPPAFDPAKLPRIAPATRLVAGGVGALRALVAHFAAHRDALDLADQVVLVADRPYERQLLGLACVFLGTTNRPRVAAPGASPDRLRAQGFTHVDAHVTSDDASPAVRDAVAAP